MRDYNSIPFKLPRRSGKSEQPLLPRDDGNGKASSTVSQNSGSTQESTPEKELFSATPVAAERGPLEPRRNLNPEASISKLRNALEESSVSGFPVEEPTHRARGVAAPPKSDAVILELRSSVRQLRRQLDKLQEEKGRLEDDHRAAVQELHLLKSPHNPHDARLGELQVQLDRAHAQILTADMVRKELEDTLEAEQYTWELRVQDQERAIQLLREECAVLQEDLQQCREQWKQAEEAYAKEVGELQEKLERAQQEAAHWKVMQQDTQDVEQLKLRLLELEQERGELQTCLDEALKELEAVDAELQSDSVRKENERLQKEIELRSTACGNDPSVLESLQHMYRWLLERSGEEESPHTSPRDVRGLTAAIQSHLERMPADDKEIVEMRNKVAELTSQISVYRGDLKAREESSAELRASLKEAVALLKPLQDAVAKADKEKLKLVKEIEDLKGARGPLGKSGSANANAETKKLKDELAIKEQEIDRLKGDFQQLEIELSRAKVATASTLLAATQRSATSDSGAPDSLTRTREDLKAKRATEKTLKQLLRDAQTRFQTLHTQNQEIEAMNSELQGRLKDAEEKIDPLPSSDSDGIETVQRQLNSNDERFHELESQLETLKKELAKRDSELRNQAQEIENFKSVSVAHKEDKALLHESQSQLRDLEAKMALSKDELLSKKEAEKALKRSLKEALSLLRPLQMHLEEAEAEKKELLQELRQLRKKGETEGKPSKARSVSNESKTLRELETTVRLLELENAQLHDALEDMSQSINASHVSGATGTSNKHDSRLREEIVQLKSRNEVTQKQLEMAKREKNSLAEALSSRGGSDEKETLEELRALREKLRKTEAELENAKFIATSALVRVEEFATQDSEQVSSYGSDFDHEAMFQEKALQLDREMKRARDQGQLPKAQYRLT